MAVLHDLSRPYSFAIVLIVFLANALTLGQDHSVPQLQLARIGVVVTDKSGRPVKDLRQEDFLVFEGNSQQTISLFSRDEVPISYGLIVDATGSMRPMFSEVVEAARTIVNNSAPGDEAFIVRLVDGEARIVVDWTSDKKSLLHALDGFGPAFGRMSIIESLYFAAGHFANRPKEENVKIRRRALVVLTDGREHASKYSLNQLFNRLKDKDLQVMAVSSDTSPRRGGIFAKDIGNKADSFLRILAAKTDGQALFPKSMPELQKAASAILDLERSQYTIGYASSNVQKRGKRKIQVQIAGATNRNTYSVRTLLLTR